MTSDNESYPNDILSKVDRDAMFDNPLQSSPTRRDDSSPAFRIDPALAPADDMSGYADPAYSLPAREAANDEPAFDEDMEEDADTSDAQNDDSFDDDRPADAELRMQDTEVEEDIVENEPAPAPRREAQAGTTKPRLCLMGEFSAGKSTLSNFLIGGSALPVNVTATQLPPVWITYGDETPYRVDLDGNEYDVDLNNLTDVSVDDTSHIRIFSKAELLKTCDLIDMPGISDPNMAPEVWQRVVHYADAVIWCTHATQAWRQSEAAVWSMMTPSLYEKSFLLLTRIDKITNDRDRERVVKRVGKETHNLFRGMFPVSLLKALQAEGDEDMLAESGAVEFMDALTTLLAELNGETMEDAVKMSTAEAHDVILNTEGDGPGRNVTPRRIRPRKLTARKLTRRGALDAPGDENAQF